MNDIFSEMRFIPSLDILLAFFDGLDKKKLLKAAMTTTAYLGFWPVEEDFNVVLRFF